MFLVHGENVTINCNSISITSTPAFVVRMPNYFQLIRLLSFQLQIDVVQCINNE